MARAAEVNFSVIPGRCAASTEQKAEADRYSILNIELGEKSQGTGLEQATPTANEAQRKAAPPDFAEMPKKDQAVSDENFQLPAAISPPAAKDTGQVLALQRPPETTSVESPEISAMDDSLARQYAANEVKTESPLSGLAMDASKPKTLAKSLRPEIATEGLRHSRDDMALPASVNVNGGFSILPAPAATSAPDSVNIGAIYVTNENVSLNQQTRAASIMEIYRDTGSVQAMMPQTSVLVTVEKMPKPLKMVMPEYPVWAGKQGLSGTLWVRARVESDGHISDAEIISCDAKGLGFEDAALKAARESTFSPASANGINLPVWIVYPVKFIYKP